MKHRKRLTGLLIFLVLVGLGAYAAITLSNTRAQIAEANKTAAELQEQVEELQESNAALQYALDNQDDPQTIEDIAREKLGLVMPDEQIFYDTGD